MFMFSPSYFLGVKAGVIPQLKLVSGLGTRGFGEPGRLMVGRGGWGVMMRIAAALSGSERG